MNECLTTIPAHNVTMRTLAFWPNGTPSKRQSWRSSNKARVRLLGTMMKLGDHITWASMQETRLLLGSLEWLLLSFLRGKWNLKNTMYLSGKYGCFGEKAISQIPSINNLAKHFHVITGILLKNIWGGGGGFVVFFNLLYPSNSMIPVLFHVNNTFTKPSSENRTYCKSRLLKFHSSSEVIKCNNSW